MASSKNKVRRSPDGAFKALFSYPRMIADAMRLMWPPGSAPSPIDALDLETLEKLPAEWISRRFRRRQGDQAWRVRFRGARGWQVPRDFALVLVEFRSRPDPNMSQYMTDLVGSLHRELEAAGVVRPSSERPPVLPLVIYNGKEPWSVPMDVLN